jgi:hypothetical protein
LLVEPLYILTICASAMTDPYSSNEGKDVAKPRRCPRNCDIISKIMFLNFKYLFFLFCQTPSREFLLRVSYLEIYNEVGHTTVLETAFPV